MSANSSIYRTLATGTSVSDAHRASKPWCTGSLLHLPRVAERQRWFAWAAPRTCTTRSTAAWRQRACPIGWLAQRITNAGLHNSSGLAGPERRGPSHVSAVTTPLEERLRPVKRQWHKVQRWATAAEVSRLEFRRSSPARRPRRTQVHSRGPGKHPLSLSLARA